MLNNRFVAAAASGRRVPSDDVARLTESWMGRVLTEAGSSSSSSLRRQSQL